MPADEKPPPPAEPPAGAASPARAGEPAVAPEARTGTAAGEAGQAEGEEGPEESALRRLVKSRGFVPTAVVVGLVLLVLLGSRLAGRPPIVDAITPDRARPGEVMIITGRYFGSERDEVRISGISPTSSDYIEWTDTRISVGIPAEAGSGLVYVVTRNGRSRGLLFINRDEIPVVDTGTAKAGEPWIGAVQPAAARVGERITVTGMNFGLERGASEVYFAWAGGAGGAAAGSSDLTRLQPARDGDFDYLSWSDREIALRVPDGATSGNLLVTSDKGRSNSVYFEVLGGAGVKTFSQPRIYSVQYGMSVRGISASGANSLYLWLPKLAPTPEQRRVQLVAQDPEPVASDDRGAVLFQFVNLNKASKPRVSMGFMVERYGVATHVTAAKVPATYEASAELAAHFTAPDRLAPSSAPEIAKASASAVGAEKNPYLKARRIYDWLLAGVAYTPTPRDGSAVTALKDRRADAFGYSALFCALARAAGVPARMVSGYLVGDPQQPTYRHFWDEFYVETVGWVPVDPLLGKEPVVPGLPADPDVDRRAFYFGSLDNRHLTFSLGLEEAQTMSPEGRTKWRRELPWLLTVDEEAVGAINSYEAVLEDLQVTGAY